MSAAANCCQEPRESSFSRCGHGKSPGAWMEAAETGSLQWALNHQHHKALGGRNGVEECDRKQVDGLPGDANQQSCDRIIQAVQRPPESIHFLPFVYREWPGSPWFFMGWARPLQCVESSSPVQAVCVLTAAGRVIQRGEDHSLRSRAFYHCSSELEAASARGRENGSPGLLVLSGSLVGSQTSSEQSSGNESRAYLFITKFKKLGLQTCHVVSSPLHLCTLIPE